MSAQINDISKVYARLNRILLVLFFLSGATALIYQVVWTRLLTLFFGSTTLAVSTVLTAFMGGLALGSVIFGKKADNVTYPARLYAWLELFIGIFAISTPLLFSLVENTYIYLHQFIGQGFWQSALLRFGLAMLLLLPPTILMGGTLPVLSKFFLRNSHGKTGKTLSTLYFINTAGAVIGTIGAGLLLLQILGIERLLFLGGAINLVIFWFAYRMPTHLVDDAFSEKTLQQQIQDDSLNPRWTSKAILATFALLFSGLAALVYEVVWTRVLTLVIGSSTYAFTIMLATFLTGIALGSAMIARFADKSTDGIRLLALCQVLIGIFALITASIFGLLPDAFVSLFGAVGDNFTLFLTTNFLLCFIVMVPATVFMGASFPVAGAIVIENFGSCGRRIGFLYAGNTIGAILGAFLAGFVLLPLLGIQKTLITTIFMNLSVGIILYLFSLRQPCRSITKFFMPAISAVLIFVLAFVWQPTWDKLKMTSGPYAYAVQYQQKSIDERVSRIKQLYYKEGPIATVAVNQDGKHLRLVVDGKTDAGNFRDMTTQVLVGHLPLLLKQDARDILVIGYASGITAGAVARHDVERIDSVEIEPAMQEASEFFRKENYNIMDDKRFNLIVDDGRSYALTSKRKYDVIISEPSNPWQSGSSRLFTREAFLNARRILNKNGIMAQWMHLYGTDVETLRLVARTFASVFPHTSLWFDPEYPDVIFIGSLDPLSIDPIAINSMVTTNPKVQESLTRIGYPDDWSIMKAFLLGEDDLHHFAGTGELNTDSLPILEYRAPKSLYSRTALQDNLKAMFASKSPESFPKVVVKVGDETAAATLLNDWGKSLAGVNRLKNAKGALHNASVLNPYSAESHYSLGYLRMHTNDITGAIDSFEKTLKLEPDNGSTYANLGALYYQHGEIEKAYHSLKKAISLGEDSAHIRNNLSVALARMGKLEEAIGEVKTALSMNSKDEVALNNLARFSKLLENKSTRQ